MKQVIVVRKDLKMPIGKCAAQVAHASCSVVVEHIKTTEVREWLRTGQKKVCLQCTSLAELLELAETAKNKGVSTALITDAGLTLFDTPTITCLAIGPGADDRIDKITGHLKLL